MTPVTEVVTHLMVTVTASGNTEKIRKDFEIDNIIQHSNNMLVL